MFISLIFYKFLIIELLKQFLKQKKNLLGVSKELLLVYKFTIVLLSLLSVSAIDVHLINNNLTGKNE